MAAVSAYPLPNATGESNQETARLDAHQEIWRLELGSFSLAPAYPPNMRLALDLGCGTGIWARTLAVQYPEALFVGVDVNPPVVGALDTAPRSSNVRFVKANVEDDWSSFVDAPASVDYTLARMLTTAIRDWQTLFDRAFQATRPGGLLETQDTCIELLSDDTEEARKSPLMAWFNSLADFAKANGIETHALDANADRLRRAGFEIKHEKEIKWYFDASRPEMKGKEEISHMVMDQISDILDTMTPKIFARSPSMSLEEGRNLAATAKVDLRQNSGKHGFHTRYCIRVAQRPQ